MRPLRAIAAALAALAAVTACAAIAAPAHASAPDVRAGLPRVVNGVPSSPGTYPYLVALLEPNAYQSRGPFAAQFCGGTLTSPSTVVTAAHCVVDQDSGRTKSAGEILIAIGSSLNAGEQTVVPISSVNVHPDYDIQSAGSDVAVLTLAEPLADAPSLAPVDPALAARAVAAGIHAYVIGWGNTEPSGNSYPKVFRVGELIVMPPETCGRGLNYAIGDTLFMGFGKSEANPEVMLCASGVNDQGDIIDACQGDSGGPLIATLEGSERLIGIVSWGTDCATHSPGVYTRVAGIYDFLARAGALAATAPTQPPAITVDPLPGSLRVTFTADGDPSVTGFSATALDPATGKTTNCVASLSNGTSSASCVLIGLVDGTSYEVTAASGNPVGQSPTSAPLTAVPAPVPIAGRIRHVNRLDAHSIQVWSTPSSGSGLALTEQTVSCWPKKGGKVKVGLTVDGVTTVTGMRKVTYSCAVTATNSIGTSSSKAIVVRPNWKGTSHLKPGGIKPKPNS